LRIEWVKNNTWFVVMMGMPVTYMFMKSVQCFVTAFDGQLWPSRLIGFGIGVAVFTAISSLIFKEPITPKTMICLGLGILIVLIQVFYK
jgi:multidrug transporter EmrE-like cation transporter